MSLSRYCVYRFDEETGAPKELPLVTVFTPAEVFEVMTGMFVGSEFETENGPLRTRVLSPDFADDDEFVTLHGPSDPPTVYSDLFLVKKKG